MLVPRQVAAHQSHLFPHLHHSPFLRRLGERSDAREEDVLVVAASDQEDVGDAARTADHPLVRIGVVAHARGALGQANAEGLVLKLLHRGADELAQSVEREADVRIRVDEVGRPDAAEALAARAVEPAEGQHFRDRGDEREDLREPRLRAGDVVDAEGGEVRRRLVEAGEDVPLDVVDG